MSGGSRPKQMKLLACLFVESMRKDVASIEIMIPGKVGQDVLENVLGY